MTLIPSSFYQRNDVLAIAEDLLGKVLFTSIDGVTTGGVILETEAYRAPEDKASHAYNGRRTKRNEVMYGNGGIAYVYLIYGLHTMFNIVTNLEEIPHAILIRAIEPISGLEHMLKRRRKSKQDKTLTNGPGSLARALGITLKQNGTSLKGPEIWLEDHQIEVPKSQIIKCPRVGIDYAEEFVNHPWRFIYSKI
jgi:DNA-3-methyladenine glycosylase